MFTNLGLVSACCYLPTRSFRNFIFNYRKKAREKSRKRSDIVQFGRWRDSFSSALCSILSQSTLFQPMTARMKYIARNLGYRYERAQFTIPFIKEIKNFFLRALLNYLSTWEFFQNNRDVREDSPSARAFPHLSSVLKNSQVLI